MCKYKNLKKIYKHVFKNMISVMKRMQEVVYCSKNKIGSNIDLKHNRKVDTIEELTY